METELIIATYSTPDLDGFSCGFALEEFLSQNGRKAKFVLFGEITAEVEFLINKLCIKTPVNGNTFVRRKSEIILVDASDITGIDKSIIPSEVIEVIDHREISEKKAFINAIYNIEYVGAAATLITEKYINSDTKISYESANLLFYAIVSNTINFKANVTTERDIISCQWLLLKGKVVKGLTKEMFFYKTYNMQISESYFSNNYLSLPVLNEKKYGIIQLEICNAKAFIKRNYKRLVAIAINIKEKENLDHLFYTIIDLNKLYNIFFTCDKLTQGVIKEILKIPDFNNDGIVKYNGVIMRKEIIPKLKKYND